MSEKIKYSSTSIDSGKSIRQISYLLREVGADRFATLVDIKKGRVGIQFFFQEQAVELVIDVKAIEERLSTNKSIRLEQRTPEGAERVAFRLLLNWLENNFELVRWGVVDTMEVFLPYLVLPTGGTLRELLVPAGPDGVRRLALPKAKEEKT